MTVMDFQRHWRQVLPQALVVSVALSLLGCTGTLPGGLASADCSKGANQSVAELNRTLFRNVRDGRVEAVQTCLEAGAQVNAVLEGSEENPITPLLVATAMAYSDVAVLLINKGADTRARYMGYGARDILVRQVGETDRSVHLLDSIWERQK